MRRYEAEGSCVRLSGGGEGVARGVEGDRGGRCQARERLLEVVERVGQ